VLGAQYPALITALRNGGYTGKLWLSNAAAPVISSAGAAANGAFWGEAFTADLPYKTSQAFTKAYKKRYNGAVPTEFSALGYDGMRFALMAVANAKSASRADILASMQQLAKKGDFAAAVGPARFQASLDRRGITARGVVVEWRNGAQHIMMLPTAAKATK
jgi:ABC-type branched-subunit amino acid transport system substrate-binding protein